MGAIVQTYGQLGILGDDNHVFLKLYGIMQQLISIAVELDDRVHSYKLRMLAQGDEAFRSST